MSHAELITHGHLANVAAYLGAQAKATDNKSFGDGTPGMGASNQDIGGSFALLIMECIEDMTNAQNEKTAVDATQAQQLSTAESKYMQQAQQDLQNIYNTDIKPYAGKTDDASQGEMQKGQTEYQLEQTDIQSQEQQLKSIVQTSTTATSTDNSNTNNFVQFAATAVQLLGFAVQLLQRQM